MIGRTEYIGDYGIATVGFLRAKLGACDHCGDTSELHRVFSNAGDGYRAYCWGEYCLPCGRLLARAKASKDERVRRERIDKEWQDAL